MSHDTITTDQQLSELCRRMQDAERVGFDTEFVSEDTFRPELCLVQVALGDYLAVIDPQPGADLTPFWSTLAEGAHTTIAHAAREEVNFCLAAVGKPPANLFDVQLASAFCGTEYPAAYSSVVGRVLGKRVAKGEQRTDWRRRPLTGDQIEYALEDVRYLDALYQKLTAELRDAGRTSWFADESADFLEEVTAARTRQRWRKVSGIGALGPRNLAIVRELWNWRQAEAERRNLPPRRVLRDDLIVELAKRKMDKEEKIRQVRGMLHGQLKRALPDIAACVERGLHAPLDDLKHHGSGPPPAQLALLGQVITPAITSICREANVAASLVGSATDVRDMIAHRLGFDGASEEPPQLAHGWRAELVGNVIDELLAGRVAIRIEDPHSLHPLAIAPLG